LLWEKAWMFAVSVVLTLVTFCFASGKAMLPDAKSIGLVLRVLIAERAIVFYVWKLIWPAWLSPFYPLMGTITLASAEFFAPALLLTAACLGVWFARRRAPALAAAWMAYIALVLPVLGLTQFGGESVANRHMYVAMLPLVLVAAGGGAWLCRRAPAVGRAALIILAAASLVYLGERTRMDVRMWHDDETFWRNVLRWYPDYAFANWKVAEGAIARRDFVTGLPCAERALEGFPKDNRIRGMLGLAYLKTHSYEAAVRTLEPLVRADTWMPAARYNLACAYARLGSNAAAFAVLRELLSREPRFIELAKRDRELAGLRGDPQFAEAIRGPAQ
jgi:tetratricopeptide (TPR) repeat protein